MFCYFWPGSLDEPCTWFIIFSCVSLLIEPVISFLTLTQPAQLCWSHVLVVTPSCMVALLWFVLSCIIALLLLLLDTQDRQIFWVFLLLSWVHVRLEQNLVFLQILVNFHSVCWDKLQSQQLYCKHSSGDFLKFSYTLWYRSQIWIYTDQNITYENGYMNWEYVTDKLKRNRSTFKISDEVIVFFLGFFFLLFFLIREKDLIKALGSYSPLIYNEQLFSLDYIVEKKFKIRGRKEGKEKQF